MSKFDYRWPLHFVIAKKVNYEHQIRWVFFRTLARRRLPYRPRVEWLYADPKHVTLGRDW